MKHHRFTLIAALLIAAMLTGCGTAAPTTPTTQAPETTAATTAPTEAPVETIPETTAPVETEEPTVTEQASPSELVVEAYAQQIGRYYTALTECWEESRYFDSEMSSLPYYYNEGEPLDNVGFGYQDLDNDGSEELIIGAIANAELDPVVFEIWTLVEGEPVMLAQSGSRNRYLLQFVEEDNMWYVFNEASNGAANFATYSLTLIDGKLEVSQGIIFDAAADEENPWFMTYDLDWDVSNDEPVDEDLANAITENDYRYITALEYIPYNLYK
jgi:hypothetical protein